MVMQTENAGDDITYTIDLSGEPGMSSYFQLHMDTTLSEQLFAFELPVDPDVIAEMCVRQYNIQDKNTLKGQIADVQVDLISHRYPLVKVIKIIDGVRLASLEDIAAMKLNAIVVNGTRVKDFVDVVCLSGYLSLSEMLDAYEVKCNTRNLVLAVNALTYNTYINHDEAVFL